MKKFFGQDFISSSVQYVLWAFCLHFLFNLCLLIVADWVFWICMKSFHLLCLIIAFQVLLNSRTADLTQSVPNLYHTQTVITWLLFFFSHAIWQLLTIMLPKACGWKLRTMWTRVAVRCGELCKQLLERMLSSLLWSCLKNTAGSTMQISFFWKACEHLKKSIDVLYTTAIMVIV